MLGKHFPLNYVTSDLFLCFLNFPKFYSEYILFYIKKEDLRRMNVYYIQVFEIVDSFRTALWLSHSTIWGRE